MNKSSARGHQNGMSVEEQLAGLRANERRNVAVEVAIRAGCACALAWALTGSSLVVAVAGFVLGLLAARRHRIPSLDELADRLDRARGTHGLVRTALASESGRANGSPLLVEHAVARAVALLRADGQSIVRPFRLPGSALAATAVICFFVSVPSSLAPSGVVEQLPGFRATGAGRDDPSSLPEGGTDRAATRRRGTSLGDFARFVTNGGRSTSGMKGAVAEATTHTVPASEPEAVKERPEDFNPCPPEFLCVPYGRGNERSPSSAGGGSNGRAPSDDGAARRTEAHGEPLPEGESDANDQGELGMETDAERGSTQRNEADGLVGDGTNGPVAGDGSSGAGDGTAEKGSVQPPRKQEESDPTDRNGGLDGAGGSDPGLGEASERKDVKIAEERVEGLWQASAEGAIDEIEDGLAGEQTNVPWRDLHAWYEAIAEDAVSKEGVPVTRRVYVQHYFDTLAPPGEAE
jgi:hypothetical protein